MARRWLNGTLGVAIFAAAGMLPAAAAERVLVPTRVIYPGETIDASSLKELVLIEGKTAPSEMAVALPDLQGKITKRTLLPGRYVPASALREAYLFEKGVSVQMLFVAGALTIAATAVTLEPGSVGDQVKVRNVDSGKILSGVVMSDGTIRVGG